MNHLLSATGGGLLQANYRDLAQQALNSRQRAIQQILSQRQLPPSGWNDLYIQSFLSEIAMMDSNNFVDSVGVGEREGRVLSSLVRSRHMGLSHGMGRSGDLLAQQPKAAGSSLLVTLTHALTLHAVKLAGLTEAKQVLLLPVATGMSIVLALAAIKQHHPSHLRAQKEAMQLAQAALLAPSTAAAALDGSSFSPLSSTSAASSCSSPASISFSSSPPLYVIWSRIDQKTCLKSIFAAGLIPIVIELKQEGDELVTDLAAIEATIVRLGASNILAIVSTTSCFAPRAPDRVIEIALLCARHGLAHVCNNAYGLQSASTCALINRAVRKRGRVDAVISSMDKNFMVPVGGAVVIGFHQPPKTKQQPPAHYHTQPDTADNISSSASPAPSSSPPLAPVSPPAVHSPLPNVLNLISALYPGRAGSSVLTDLLITLLSMGADGWVGLLATREALVPKLKARLVQLATQHGERLLDTPHNDISFAMTLNQLRCEEPVADDEGSTAESKPAAPSESRSKFSHSYLGSLLFSRNVSGPRVLSPHSPSVTMHGLTFERYGTHSNSYPHAYITAACSIGMEEREIDIFATRLDKCIHTFRTQMAKSFQSASNSNSA